MRSAGNGARSGGASRQEDCMSRRLHRFTRLREIEHATELEAAQKVVQARQVVDRERIRLRRMQQEHTQRCAEAARRALGDRLEVDRESSVRSFLERLERSIVRQTQTVIHASKRLEEHVAALREKRQHRKALQRFEERILLQEKEQSDRREQNDTDEIGINVFRGNERDVT